MHATTSLRRLLFSSSLPSMRLPSTLPASAGTGAACCFAAIGRGQIDTGLRVCAQRVDLYLRRLHLSQAPCRELRVVGNSHQLRFRPSARDLFPEIRDRGITPRAEGKPSIEVPTAELPGIVTADEALVHHIIFLNRVTSAHAELRSLPKEAAQQYFQQYLQLPGKIQERQSEALKNISTADVYELRYQDLQQAIDCLDLLAGDPGKPR